MPRTSKEEIEMQWKFRSIAATVVALLLFGASAFAQLGQVIGSNDIGQGKMKWDLDSNTVIWSIGGGSFPNTVGYNGTDVFHVTGDNGCSPLPVNRIDAGTGAILSSFTLDGMPGGACTHLEDLAFTGPNDLWGADIFNLRLVRYDITTGSATLLLPITGSFFSGNAVFYPTGIASTPLGMYATASFGGEPPEVGVIDTTTGVYTPVFPETCAPYGGCYIHSLAYDSSRGVLWLNLSGASGSGIVLRQRNLDGTSAGPDVVMDPSPVSYRFDGFEHLSAPVLPKCGDGKVEGEEECDDGNVTNGDGCSAQCKIEVPICGDGNLDPGEECDDGNILDGDGCSGVCKVENHDPDCSSACANPDYIWPPNHKGVPVVIGCIVDPDGDAVVVTATSIYQDEPVLIKGGGAGNTSPDAQLSPLMVRAERNGNPKTPGNGRVYHISFTADDGNGGTCTGEVHVCVPHDQGGSSVCVDGGPLYNSVP